MALKSLQRKLWRICWQFIENPSIYKYWWGKFWQITNRSPNSPKFSPSKIFPRTVTITNVSNMVHEPGICT